MKTAKELYPSYYEQELKDGSFYGPYDYQPIIDSLGEVLIQKDDDDYQGDTRVLIKNGNKYGFLIFGWGSCSGCDALQACNNTKEVDDVISGIYNDIKWFDSIDYLKSYVGGKDWELEYSYNQEETKQFIEQVKNYQ